MPTFTGATTSGSSASDGSGLATRGTLDLFGTGFSDTPAGGAAMILPGDTGTILGGSGTLSGTLADGQALDATTYSVDYGTLEFNVGPSPFASPAAVPEPSTVAVFFFGGVALLGLALRARRRQSA